MSRVLRAAALLALGLSLSACGAADRLANIGAQPKLTAIQDPTAQAGYKPVRMPMPSAQPVSYAANSLWRSGARGFFKDQRAHQVGDIVTVKVKVTDKADLDNSTKRARDNTESFGTKNLFGAETRIGGKFLRGADASALLNADSSGSSAGTGQIRRKEELITNVAGVVTQVLPNGNLVIEGKQEIRVNFEVRELIVAGIVRPEDIESDNTIESNKIAEARIAYGGRGQITDVQQPRYGQQALDVLLPF